MAKELKVGDCVYARILFFDGRTEVEEGGEISELRTIDGIRAANINGKWIRVSALRRLKRKEKPPERVERWLYLDSYAKEKLCNTRGECESLGKRTDAHVAYVHLVELKPGEVPVSREKLAEAWKVAFAKAQERDSKLVMITSSHRTQVRPDDLAEALGLGREGKKE